MKTTKEQQPISPMRRGANSYKVAPKEPFSIPDLGFTEEENRRMDEFLKEQEYKQ